MIKKKNWFESPKPDSFVSLVSNIFFLFSFLFFCLCMKEWPSGYIGFIDWKKVICKKMDGSFFDYSIDFGSCAFISLIFFICGCLILYLGFCSFHKGELKMTILFILILVIIIVFLVSFPKNLVMLMSWDCLVLFSYVFLIIYFFHTMNNKKHSKEITDKSKTIGSVLLFMSSLIIWYGMKYGGLNILFSKFGLAVNLIFILLILLLIGMMSNKVMLSFHSIKTYVVTVSSFPYLSLVFCFVNVVMMMYILISFQDLCYPLVDSIMYGSAFMSILIVAMSSYSLIDFNKIVVLTILNQMTVMVFLMKMELVGVAFFYLMAFMCFQSLMLLCLGVMKVSFENDVNEKIVSSMSWRMPLVYSLYVMSNYSLMTFPFICMYCCKELIFFSPLVKSLSLFSGGFLFFSLSCYLFYCMRMMWLFISLRYYLNMELFPEAFFYVNFSLFLLGVMSFVVGLSTFVLIFKMNEFLLTFKFQYVVSYFFMFLWVFNVWFSFNLCYEAAWIRFFLEFLLMISYFKLLVINKSANFTIYSFFFFFVYSVKFWIMFRQLSFDLKVFFQEKLLVIKHLSLNMKDHPEWFYFLVFLWLFVMFLVVMFVVFFIGPK